MTGDMSTRRALEIVLSRCRIHYALARDLRILLAEELEREKRVTGSEPEQDPASLIQMAIHDLSELTLLHKKQDLLDRFRIARHRMQSAIDALRREDK